MSIHTAAENACIADKVIPQDADAQVWIGLSDNEVANTWKWTDGSGAADATTFDNWNPG